MSGARERERAQMLEVLMRRPAADAVVVQAQAARAEWLLPERLAPVAVPAALRAPLSCSTGCRPARWPRPSTA